MKKSRSLLLCFSLVLFLLTGLFSIAAAEQDSYEELTTGSSGEAVVALQTRLTELGYYSSIIDGNFGNQTKASLNIFLDQNGFEQTGIATPDILEYLYSDKALPAPPRPAVEITKFSLNSNRVQFSVRNNTDETINYIEYQFILMDSDGNAYRRYDFDAAAKLSDNNTLDDVSYYWWYINTTIRPGATRDISEPRYNYYNLTAPELAIGVTAYTTTNGTRVDFSEYEVAYLTTKGRQLWAIDRVEETEVLSSADYEKARTVLMGFTSQEIPYYLTTWLQLPEGYYITDVTPDSIADALGLQPGDVLTHINGEPVKNRHAIEKAKLRMLNGEETEVLYWRANQEHTARCVLDIEQTKLLNDRVANEQEVPATVSVADELLKYADLLEKGLITQEEYQLLKDALLNK